MPDKRDDEAPANASTTPDEEPANSSLSPEDSTSGERSDIHAVGPSDLRQGGVLERRALVHGEKIGSHYVRKQFTHMDEFRRRSDGVLEATERTLAPKSGIGKGSSGSNASCLGSD